MGGPDEIAIHTARASMKQRKEQTQNVGGPHGVNVGPRMWSQHHNSGPSPSKDNEKGGLNHQYGSISDWLLNICVTILGAISKHIRRSVFIERGLGERGLGACWRPSTIQNCTRCCFHGTRNPSLIVDTQPTENAVKTDTLIDSVSSYQLTQFWGDVSRKHHAP